MNRKVIIIGTGPAGLTAAIYAARANLQPLVFEGQQPGGQLTITSEVENFPGFPEGITGPELMDSLRKQAQKFGAETVFNQITKVDFSRRPFKVWSGDNLYTSDTVIISTGASAQWLGLKSEKKLMGYGVSACATCDGFFYRDKKVLVVGGGDSAAEEAIFLTKFASEVWLVHRRDELRASKIMTQRIMDNPKINVHWNSVITEVLGTTDSGVVGVKLEDTKTGTIRQDDCDGVFLAIGHTPNTEIFNTKLELNAKGYIVTKPDSTYTSVPGVFACGDVQDSIYRQAITAAGSGCMAAIDAERYLED
ncbi:MAG: thioredoxin-disulfide reductase [Candidatus Marinimicrobia bacterium]|nr:thioredoxin-disulfide reductase [Candidatus Neomarinimicrobiota bacterium]